MIRTYNASDKERIIELLDQNTPEYFDPSEKDHLVNYLAFEIEDYFVFELDGKVVGCGGVNFGFDNGRAARISWDIVSKEHHGHGIGRRLVQHRIEHIKTKPEVKKIVVRTTQLVYKFYEKQGFEMEMEKKNFWAKDLHLYQLVINLK